MCASSSTTRILELTTAATASIARRPARRLSCRHERNVKRRLQLFPALGVGARRLAGRALLPTRPQHQLQRVAEQAEAIPDLLLEGPPVGEVEELGVVDEEDDCRSFPARLRGIAESEAPPLEARRRVRQGR